MQNESEKAAERAADKPAAKDNALLSNRRGKKRVFGLRMAKGFDPSRGDRDLKEKRAR